MSDSIGLVDLDAGSFDLELGLQELEPLTAPSFWTGYKEGLIAFAPVGVLFVAAMTVAAMTT